METMDQIPPAWPGAGGGGKLSTRTAPAAYDAARAEGAAAEAALTPAERAWHVAIGAGGAHSPAAEAAWADYRRAITRLAAANQDIREIVDAWSQAISYEHIYGPP